MSSIATYGHQEDTKENAEHEHRHCIKMKARVAGIDVDEEGRSRFGFTVMSSTSSARSLPSSVAGIP